MTTEGIDPRFLDLEQWPTGVAVQAMLEGQMAAIAALSSQVAAIASASDAAAERLSGGGRLAYAGAGTSGRIAIQDGVELTPTYNWPEARLVFFMAGGPGALLSAVEGAEDDAAAARAQVAEAGIGAADVLVAVAASGRTPFALAALDAARAAGALTVAVANNPATPLLLAADHAILADTGPEAVAGSTRMKAGTAQKAALNLFSTATMLRLGLVHQGLMVNMRVTNAKLLARARNMVRDLAGVEPAIAEAALDAAGNDIRHAVLIARGFSLAEATARLARHRGRLREALAEAP